MKKPLQTRIVQALNRAGLADMHGAFYTSDSHEVTRFVLRRARAEFAKERNRLRRALVVARARITEVNAQRPGKRRTRYAGYAVQEIDAALSHD